ncbi:TrmH family RNA methyltransferase [Xylanibacter ruminicola]|uniref:RNA methyltransferase, TrmH family n=1 Tax=Xylanibacter ruminicola TaxID=839 RepID=A0A1M6VLX9_XYLRU|nr:RNA methyltransferase [Xylanibacter ruminicola]SHK82498.1 RNA methyltransferase, TrmH family [Xylanibacter ruminicola]
MEETIITSVQNARIKHVVALQQKSSLRREEGLFVVEGQREIEHCRECGYEIVEEFCRECEGTEARGRENTTMVSPNVYEKMAYRGSTEGMIAVAKCKEHSLAKLQLKENPLIVILESVEKPGNLGAVLRSAEASGVDAVIVCDPLTDMYNPNLIRASIGGVFSVPTAVCTSQECIAFLKERGIKILTAQLQDSYEYYDYDMRPATAIVMGTESTGLTNQWRQAADAHIRIPMLGRLDSLNVSVSAAILMYEALRQRRVNNE